jgi:hypothetical protein
LRNFRIIPVSFFFDAGIIACLGGRRARLRGWITSIGRPDRAWPDVLPATGAARSPRCAHQVRGGSGT